MIPRALLSLLIIATAAAQERPAALAPWAENVRAEGARLLLRDWQPATLDVVPVTRVPRARFPAIDVHNHIDHTVGPERLAAAVAEMDAANVQTVVALTCGWGDTLRRNVERLAQKYPGRFLLCTQVDVNAIDSPDFAATAVERLREAHRLGARGIKFRKDLGCYLKDKTGRYVAVNDPRMEPIWTAAGELGMPVFIHVADPLAFFHPWDAMNPAWRLALARPRFTFFFHGPDWAGTPRFTHDELMRQRDDIVARHPKTTFVALHFASLEHDLARLGALLDRHPNLLIETGARQWTLGIKPNAGRKFAIRYQGRILFGTDATIARATYETYFRAFETDDDFIETHPAWGAVHGLNLPADVLEKIYRGNARKLFALPH